MAKRRSRALLLPAAVLAAVVGFTSVDVGARQGLLQTSLSNLLNILPNLFPQLVPSLTSPVLSLLQPVLHLLTNELLAELVAAPDRPARIIMRGAVPQLLDVAARRGLPVHRVLDEF